MICSNCGNEIPDGAKFCAKCGAATVAEQEQDQIPAYDQNQVQYEQPVQQPVKTSPLSFITQLLKNKIILGAVVVVLLVIVIVAIMPSKSKYEQSKGSTYISELEDGVVVIPVSGKKVEYDGSLNGSQRSSDGTKAAFLVLEDGDSSSDGYTLYHIDGTPKKVADGVYSFKLALSGNGIAYTTERDYDDYTTELYLYNGGKSTKITTKARMYGTFCISPDGKTVGYTEDDDGDLLGFLWDGKVKDLGKNKQPQFVADGAKYVYYIRSDSYYVQKGTNDDTKVNLGDSISSVSFNKDLSQALYSSGSSTYLTRDGGKKESMTGSFGGVLVPAGTWSMYDNGAYVYGIDNFAGTMYGTYNSAVVYINNKYASENVVKNVDYAYLAGDGKTVFYLKSDSVYKMNGTKPDSEATELTDDDVYSFAIVDGGAAIYYVNSDDELYYQKGKGKPVSIADDVSSSYITSGAFKDGKTFFYISDAELYSTTGGKGSLVKGIDGDVRSVSAGLFAVSVTTNDSGDICVYRSTDGKSFTQIGIQ